MVDAARAERSAANRELMRRNIEELFARGDASLIPELYWPDVVDHNPLPGQRDGHDGLRDVLAAFHTAFPDQRMELHGTLADGDHGVDYWTFRATHTGDLDGWPATGRHVEFKGIDVTRIVDGRIKEIFHVEDMAAMWQQLGRTLPRAAPAAGIRRAFAALGDGQVHYAECGQPDAPPVLLLHQTPRSWREYRDVLPLLGRTHRAIAMDTIGFGDSVRPAWPASIERWAAVAVELLDALGIERVDVVGHHTGGVIAVELAANHADRIGRVVLSSTPFTDEAFRRARAERPPIDEIEQAPDGGHLAELWRRRQAFYPDDRPDLLHAFVADALVVLDRLEDGHRAVGHYRMEDVIGRITRPVLVIRATDDPFAAPHASELAARLADAVVVDVPGGMVPLPDQLPEAFAAAVLEHLNRPDRAGAGGATRASEVP